MSEGPAGLLTQWPFLLNEAAYYEIVLDELETKHRKLSEEASAAGDDESMQLQEEISTLYLGAQPHDDVVADPSRAQEHVLSSVERLLEDHRTAVELRASLDELHEQVRRR